MASSAPGPQYAKDASGNITGMLSPAGVTIPFGATNAEVDSRIQAVVGAAPAALDTLVEIAAQMATDQTAASALTTAVSLKAPLASPTFTGSASVAGAANTAALSGSDAASPVTLTATGTDANIGVNVVTKGAGAFTVNGAAVGGASAGGASPYVNQFSTYQFGGL